MSIWQRIISRLKLGRTSGSDPSLPKYAAPNEPESITLPVFDSYDEETNRYTEIRYSSSPDQR